MAESESEEKYIAPPGTKWAYVGKCSCRGQDMACAEDSSQWRAVPVDDDWCYDWDGNVVDLR